MFSMTLERYSAVEMFGVPIEKGGEASNEHMLELMLAYNIDPQAVPAEPTDITPYYWQNSNLLYYAALLHPEGPAVVDLLPRHADSETYLVLQKLGNCAVGLQVTEVRRIEIPTNQQALAIAGPGPRFPDRICVHELIMYTD